MRLTIKGGVQSRAANNRVNTVDGAWSKKQVCCPMFEPEVFRKQMYCFGKKVLMTLLEFFGPPAVIRCPGNCALLPHSLRLWCYAMKIGKYSES